MSKVFNMVTVSAIKFADATSDGSIPSALKSINVLAEGKFTPALEPGSTTQEFDEFSGLPYRSYRGNGSFKFTMDLPKISIEDYATFTGCTYEQATDALSMGGSKSIPKAQYFEIYGDSTNGEPLVFTGYCCDIVAKWSGSVGSAQATVPVSVEASMRLDNGTPAKLLSLKPVV